MAAKQTSTEPSDSPPRHKEGIRETADSIIVAFILAFVFRAFVIEAFVIPTGSMAATLYGKHGTMVCRDCGWEFAYGLTDPASAARGRRVLGPNHVAMCPNCNYANRLTEINDVKGNGESGDRILALKWPYDVGGKWLGPKRWDVTLFKDPSDPDISDGVTNFIKRMVGLPDEVLEIIDGDVYTVPVEQLSESTLKALDDARHAKYLRRSSNDKRNPAARQLEFDLAARWDDVLDELAQEMRICRKTPLAQKELWTVLYDHDFPPGSSLPDQPHWAKIDSATSGWETSGRKLRFQSDNDNELPQGLALRGKKANDRVGYNVIREIREDHGGRAYVVNEDKGRESGVTDVRLRFVCTWSGGNGTLDLQLPKRERSFWAELSTDGTLRLYETAGDRPTVEKPLSANKLPSLEPGQSIVVDFQNVDYHVSLRINGELLLETTAEQFSPDIAALRELDCSSDTGEIQIWACGASVELAHVVTERDVHYRSPERRVAHHAAGLAGFARVAWGCTGNPILLRDGEYFMLGDNSPASGDSRLWSRVGPHLTGRGEDYQLGTVAEDQLIGRAFFVYWPSGHRSAFIPILDRLGVIPDVGRMRWIR